MLTKMLSPTAFEVAVRDPKGTKTSRVRRLDHAETLAAENLCQPSSRVEGEGLFRGTGNRAPATIESTMPCVDYDRAKLPSALPVG